MRNRQRRNLPLRLRHISQQLVTGPSRIAVMGVRSSVSRLFNAVLRHLHDDRVFNARLRVEPEIRRNLPTARKRQQHVVRDIFRGQRELLRFQPVHFDVQLRRIDLPAA